MTKREIYEQLLSAYAIAQSHAEAFASRDTAKVRDILRDIILDLAVPVEEKKEGRDIWSWYDCPGRGQNGRKCDKTDCRSCPFRPANTIPACDWPPVEQVEAPYKGVEKIVDPTGKNPTSYKCPFCNAFTITQDGTTCIVGDPNGKCSQCGRVIMLLGERKEEGKI